MDLLGFAVGHSSWAGVGTNVTVLAQETGRRIVLTDQNRRMIVDSEPGGRPLPASVSAGVDPLSVDLSVVNAGPDRISPSAVGPYALSQSDVDYLGGLAQRALERVRQRARSGRS